ncbi:MAG: DUF1223 domain-containing protein [Bryobacteraceae bacterium]
MKLLTIAILVACTVPGIRARGADNPSASPILVELFTSEGCSSCPPVDAWVQRMDASQPVPGAQLIVLSEHVDYWNHDGWKDPYSSSLLTQRQSAYAQALRISEAYTPQVIVDGTAELKLSDAQRTSQIFQKAAAAPAVPVRIESVSVEGNNPPTVRGRIETDADSENHPADVYVAIALDHAESQVLRGENSGKRLTHVAVVEYLKQIGKLEAGKGFSQDFQMKLKPGMDSANIRIIAFVQEPGPGKVLGSALQKPPMQLKNSGPGLTSESLGGQSPSRQSFYRNPEITFDQSLTTDRELFLAGTAPNL